MDRLLQGVFGAFIRRGTFKLTTSRGRTFVFGAGTGVPVAVRLTSRRAELWLLRYTRRRFAQFNPRNRARRNVAHHYDLDGRLYSLFLDADRQYSCAYFE